MKLIHLADQCLDVISKNKILTAIRRGLLFILPIVMVGSFVLMILNLPIPAFQSWMEQVFGAQWKSLGLAIYKGTYDIMALAALLSISYAYGQSFPAVLSGQLRSLSLILCSLCCFFAFDPVGDVLIQQEAANSNNLFGAIAIAIISTRVYLFFFTHIHRKNNVYSYDADGMLLYSLGNIFPLLCTISLFALVRILSDLLRVGLMFDQCLEFIYRTFLSEHGGLATTILYIVIIQFLWFFGMHGSNILDLLATTLFVSTGTINITLARVGLAPTEIITKEFLDAFVFMGGAGCTLGLLIALLLSKPTCDIKRVAKYSLLPGLFNINETIVYGLPIAFNPYFLIPFILSPVVNSVVSYVVFWAGLVPLTTQRVAWPTPILLSGYASTGSISGAVLQVVSLAISVAIYLPFVKLYNQRLERSNRESFEMLSAKLLQTDTNKYQANVLGHNDELDNLARMLVSELEQAVHSGQDPNLQLHYQPKVWANGQVYGVEALIRWTHPVYGAISPLVILSLCNEFGLFNDLGRWVIRESCAQLSIWNQQGYRNINLSFNLMPRQIHEDPELLDFLLKTLEKTGVAPKDIEMELTEHEAVTQGRDTTFWIQKIRKAGISLSIDDFGMGSSSMLYIRDSLIDTVKLDLSLVQAVNSSLESREIIRSTFSLCKEVGISVVAEGVETQEQLDTLSKMGCPMYQGFLFSKALSGDEFLIYLSEHGQGTFDQNCRPTATSEN